MCVSISLLRGVIHMYKQSGTPSHASYLALSIRRHICHIIIHICHIIIPSYLALNPQAPHPSNYVQVL